MTWGAGPPLNSWWVDPWTPPPRPAPPRRARGALIALGVLLGYAVVAAGIVALGALADDEVVVWDEQVAPLAAFVEDARGLEFDHAVAVEYLDDEEWDQYAGGDPELDGDVAAEDLQTTVAFLRTLGLAEGDPDLLEQYSDFASASYVGFYEYEDEKIRVHADPDERLSLATQDTIVHELTHALQDQHFDIESMYDESDSADSLAVQALVEGDAVLVEQEWVAELSDAEFDELYADFDDDIAAADEVEIPVGIEAISGAPYDLGVGFVYMLDALGGSRRDDAFRATPESDEHILDPLTFLDGEPPEEVDAPELPEDAEEDDSGTFGALGFYVMLSERIDPHMAFAATNGWGGDSYLQYRVDDATCVSINFVGDTRDDLEEMRSALAAWIEALPSIDAEVAVDDDVLEFRTCDPGPDAVLRTGNSIDALALPVTRGQLIAYSVEEGAGLNEAQCFADKVVADLTIAELVDPEGKKWEDPDWLDQVAGFQTSCLTQATRAGASRETLASLLARPGAVRSRP